MSDIPPYLTSNSAIAAFSNSSIMVTMDVDGGNVKIDWAEVERQAEGHDGYLRPLAKALLAVRDKNYRPISGNQ